MTEEIVTNNKGDSNNDDTKDDTIEQPLVWEIEENCWLIKEKWHYN